MRAVAPFGIVAHRGVTAGMRENSVEAFRRAMEVGVDAVELDARLTGDRVPVVLHNYYLDDDVTPVFTVEYEKTQLLQLEAVIDEFAGRLGLEIELKGPEPETALAVARLLNAHRVAWDRIEVTSSEPLILRELRDLCPGLSTALLFPTSESWMGQDVVAYAALHRTRGAAAPVVHLSATQASAYVVKTIRGGGIDVHAHSVNDDTALQHAIDLQIGWVCTDEPERALAFRRGLGTG